MLRCLNDKIATTLAPTPSILGFPKKLEQVICEYNHCGVN